MLIWGTTQLKSVVETGVFDCPQCQCETQYKRKKATEYFTLYFIPLIPLGFRGFVTECQQCKLTYTDDVLNFDPDAEKITNQAAVFRILISFMVYFHKTSEQHVEACQATYSRLLEQDVPVEIVEKELQLAMEPDAVPQAYIESEGNTFSTEAKLQILASAKFIVLAESVDEEHVQLVIGQCSEMMGLPGEDFEQIYEVVSQLAAFQQ